MNRRRAQLIANFRDDAKDPNTSVYVVVIRDHRIARSEGIGNTADFGFVLESLANDCASAHQYGVCAHCDRIAMAIRAARDAFRAVLRPGDCEHLETRQ